MTLTSRAIAAAVDHDKPDARLGEKALSARGFKW
jgi:hypothetical protein